MVGNRPGRQEELGTVQMNRPAEESKRATPTVGTLCAPAVSRLTFRTSLRRFLAILWAV